LVLELKDRVDSKSSLSFKFKDDKLLSNKFAYGSNLTVSVGAALTILPDEQVIIKERIMAHEIIFLIKVTPSFHLRVDYYTLSV
jgi:hypothetical protein